MRINPITVRPLGKFFMATAAAAMITSSVPASKVQAQSDSHKSVIIGNITYYVNDLKEKDAVREIKYEDGQTEYFVSLKSGTVINYYDKQRAMANVIEGMDFGYGGKYAHHGIQFNNCSLKSITGTNNRDYYYLSNTVVDTVDFKKCEDSMSVDELRMKGSVCRYLKADGEVAISDVGKVYNLNEGWFGREEWFEEDM